MFVSFFTIHHFHLILLVKYLYFNLYKQIIIIVQYKINNKITINNYTNTVL